MTRIDRRDDAYVLSTSQGELPARRLVVAASCDRTPHLPDWPGRDAFAGELVHAAAYRSAAPPNDADIAPETLHARGGSTSWRP